LSLLLRTCCLRLRSRRLDFYLSFLKTKMKAMKMNRVTKARILMTSMLLT
jgi:hypothetical protein